MMNFDSCYKCWYCQNEKSPRCLPCSHTFCETCLKNYLKERGFDRYGYFPCPACNFGIMIPAAGIGCFKPFLNNQPANQEPHFQEPIGLHFMNNNDLVITDKKDSRIFIYGNEGNLKIIFSCKEKIYSCCKSLSDSIYLTTLDPHSPLFLEFSMLGKRVTRNVLKKMEAVHGICCLDNPSEIAVSSVETNSITIISEGGRLIRKINGKGLLGNPYFLATDGERLFISDHLNHNIKILSRIGKLKATISSMGTTGDHLYEPMGLVVDKEGNIIVADSGNRSVKCFSPCGNFCRIISDFQSSSERPVNVALSQDQSLLCILFSGSSPRYSIINYEPVNFKKIQQCF